MHHIVRTRSQHFVSSPRKTATPLRHSLYPGRHPPKRRRLGSQSFVIPRAVQAADVDSDDSLSAVDDDEMQDEQAHAEGSRSGQSERSVLTSDGGQQAVNRASHQRSNRVQATSTRRLHHANGRGKGKGKARVESDVFGNGMDGDDGDSSSSPRKRKRSHRDPDSVSDSGSWIEMDADEEEEPDFIAESDQHLIDSAPPYALHRLRKAELIRLWKVAGMWAEDDVATVISADDENDAGMGKKELVDGLVAARKPMDRLISPLPSSPSRMSPRRKGTHDSVPENHHSMTSSSQQSPASSSSSDKRPLRRREQDTDVTPKAPPRTRAKVRLAENTLIRTAPRRTRDRRKSVPTNGFKRRTKSMGEEKGDKKARFGDDVKSPAKGLLDRRTRRSSTLSSVYTTTDTSPPEDPAESRHTPRKARRQSARGHTPGRRGQTMRFKSTPSRKVVNGKVGTTEMDPESEEDETTPLALRLRPRGARNSFVKDLSSEVDADDEENEDEGETETATVQDEDEGVEGEEDDESGSPALSRRLRSRDKIIDSDVSMTSSEKIDGRSLPARGAKQKAIEALKGGGSRTNMDVDVDMDQAEEEDYDEAMDVQGMEADGESRTRTRAQRKSYSSPKKSPPTRRSSRASPATNGIDHDEAIESDLTITPEGSPELINDVQQTPAPVHTTRSGKAFGVMRSRKKRLRQEAKDDPDMEDEDEVDDDGDDDDDETDKEESFVADIDLTDATVTSLTRMLRDELVQMCEVRGIEVGGTKPQLAKALLIWRDEQIGTSGPGSNPSSQATARPGSSPRQSKSKKFKSKKIIHAVASTVHVPGKTTPVLLRDHVHATDPATPPHSDESKPINSEAELNLDLSELGLEDSIIKPQNLTKLEKIGSGGFKDVFVGKLRGRRVAISEFREHLSEMDIRELKLLAEFSHPNIVKFRGICIPEDSSQVPCMLVSELCENGDLFDYVRNVPCPSLRRLLNLMLDIARGLEYLHTRKPSIIHRDCKSSNILINRQGVAKVGDFGLARVKNSTRSMIRSLVGTVNWQAPELWHPHPRYDYKVDVFSAAMVYWEMMAGWIGDKKYPWEGHNEHYIYDAVGAKQRRPSIAGMRKHWGDEPVNLMERMWHQEAAERPTMTDVVADLESLIAEC